MSDDENGSGGKRKRGGDSEEEEDQEENQSEDEEQEEERSSSRGKGKRKRRRKEKDSGASRFFSLEAEEDSNASEDEEVGEDQDDMFANEAEEAEQAAASLDRGHSDHRKTNRLLQEEEPEDLEQEVQSIRERHRGYSGKYDLHPEQFEQRAGDVAQQSNLPAISDPKLWLVGCRLGKERESVISLMQKFMDLQDTENRLLIKSAIACDNLKEKIYVEAEKESHVKLAIAGLRNLREYGIKLVPIKEMPTVLTVQKRKQDDVQRGSWVKIKKSGRTAYSGDIGQIYELNETKTMATVRLIPRLDYTKKDGGSDDRNNAAKTKPPARPFNFEEAKEAFGKNSIDVKTDQGTKKVYYILFGKEKFINGFLHKKMKITSLETQDIVPSIDVVQQFVTQEAGDASASKGVEADEIARAMATVNVKKRANLAKGDLVKVIEGDLKHLMGVVQSVDDESVTILPKHEDLKDPLTFKGAEIDHLSKHFEIGVHVKVIGGRHEGETGMIIRLEQGIATIYTDVTMKEISVLTVDLQECTEVASGSASLGNYELHDLIQLDQNKVGVIVKVDREGFKVLDQNGQVSAVKLQEVINKRTNKRAVAFDKHHHQIGVGDVLQVVEGNFKGKQGTIRHIYRYFCFLHSNDILENTGIFVVRTASAQLLGGRKAGMGGSSNGVSPFPPNSPFGATRGRGGGFPPPSPFGSGRGGHSDRGGGFGGRGGGRGRGRGSDGSSLVHQTVIIQKGTYKGLVGIVVDCSETTARIELHTKCKIVSIDKNNCQRINNQNSNGTSNIGGGSMNSSMNNNNNSYSNNNNPYHSGMNNNNNSYNNNGMNNNNNNSYGRTGSGALRAPQTPVRMATPSLASIGTPSHTSWDIGPTPVRGAYDDLTPSSINSSHSNYNPTTHTPSSNHHNDNTDYSMSVPTPGYNYSSVPYSPATPLTRTNNSHNNSNSNAMGGGHNLGGYMDRPTPDGGAGMYNPTTPTGGAMLHNPPLTPGTLSTHTPAMAGYSSMMMDLATPGMHPSISPSPRNYEGLATPSTPGILSHSSIPQTPGLSEGRISYDDEEDSGNKRGGMSGGGGDWTAYEGIEVKVIREGKGGKVGEVGVVKGVNADGSCRVGMESSGKEVVVAHADLEPVPPGRKGKDKLKIVRGHASSQESYYFPP
eukprot:TRINITY_DN78_c0_g1_i1.p1 TRINITY_DN78_c0_g1~~TRINITY_DN78_c0_g1_i1.p1  ORF type:complete len:1177 (+),score=447.91 TRINITY_DN78_c0_g1_i1:70-3531(+)